MSCVFIYQLIDPRTREVFYIGQTKSPRRRFNELCSSRDTTNCTRWVCSILNAGLKPDMRIVEGVPTNGDYNMVEIEWIYLGRAEGWPLTNISDGGPGSWGHVVTEEHKQSISKANTGNQHGVGNTSTLGVKMPGEDSHYHKLTDEDVLSIRRRVKSGELYSSLSVEYKIHPSNMSKIVNRKTWTHLREEN